MRILVTGGCGFIGSNLVRYLREHHPADRIVVLDALTYAGREDSLGDTGAFLMRGDVTDAMCVERVFVEHRPDVVAHLAAETHVDRSILGPAAFTRTNAFGTAVVLEAARRAEVERFLLVSTDEVYGDLAPGDAPCREDAPLRPSSPYAASKLAADQLALAYYRTYGFPVVVARPTNHYGPRQYPEKLIPHAILQALAGEAIPIYGDGRQQREWVHVEDGCAMINALLRRGRPGEVYNLGSAVRRENIEIARRIVEIVGRGRIEHVADRPGHDRRYAVNSEKFRLVFNWDWPRRGFEERLAETVAWYRDNEAWWRPIVSGEYRGWVEKNYGQRAEMQK